MFIQIPSKDVFYSDNGGLEIRCIDEPFFLNLDSLIQVEFQGCVIHKEPTAQLNHKNTPINSLFNGIKSTFRVQFLI